jgi:hypothetical protein
MTKHVFTKTQAVSVLDQVKTTKEVDLFKPVDAKHKLFKMSCEDLEKELTRYLGANQVAAVVEEV